MSLEDKLAALRAASKQRIPADKLAEMHAATAALRGSGLVQRAIQVGSRLPPFALANARGETVASADLLARGPVVLTVFRGHW